MFGAGHYVNSMIRHVHAYLRAALLASAMAVSPAGNQGSAQSIVALGESFLQMQFAIGERAVDGSRSAALVLDIKPGWKTYWRSPGEAGVPPRFDWSASQNLQDAHIHWPRPMAFESFGMTTLGYEGRAVLPVTLVPVDPSRPIALVLKAELGVCKDICVFEHGTVNASIAPGDPAQGADLVSEALGRLPISGAQAGIAVLTCSVAGGGADRAFSARLSLPEGTATPMVVLEGPENTWFHQQSVAQEGGDLAIDATLSSYGEVAWIGRDDIRITVLGDDMAAEIQGCVSSEG